MSKAPYSLIASLVLTAGITLSFVIPYLLHTQNSAEIHYQFEAAARDRYIAIQQKIQRSINIGKAITGLYAASDKVTREEFSSFTKLFLNENKFVRALEWVPRIPANERENFKTALDKIYSDMHIKKMDLNCYFLSAENRDEYFPVFFVEPFEENKKVFGYDLACDQDRFAALSFARDNNIPTTTRRIQLVQDQSGKWGLLMFFPVYKNGLPLNTMEQRHNFLLGFVVTVFDISTLIESALQHLRPAGLHILVRDLTGEDAKEFLYLHNANVSDLVDSKKIPTKMLANNGLKYENSINVNDHQWQISIYPEDDQYQIKIKAELWLIGVSLLVITFLLNAYMRLLHKREIHLRSDKSSLEKIVQERTRELLEINEDLEAYSYSVAHDLRAPLRSIVGFSQIIQEDAAAKLNEEEKTAFSRIIAAAKHMSNLIDDILELSRVSRKNISHEKVDLSKLCQIIAENLNNEPSHKVEWRISDGIYVRGDAILLRLLLENLLGNAYKFSAKKPHAVIEFGLQVKDGARRYFVKDNGIGVDMQYAHKIFGVFQRLHCNEQYEGTGIGLATAQRIVKRHGGHIWIESKEREGTDVYFTLNENDADCE